METLQRIKNVTNNKVLAIVQASEWFKDAFESNQNMFFIRPEDYVVCTFHEYLTGNLFNDTANEGLTTIAICKSLDDAEHIYSKRLNSKKW
jgi:hypothetical protein